jgi:hypothetical protein
VFVGHTTAVIAASGNVPITSPILTTASIIISFGRDHNWLLLLF